MSFSVDDIRQAADEAIAAASAAAGGGAIDPRGAREVFEGAIFEWTDELAEDEGGDPAELHRRQVRRTRGGSSRGAS